MNEVRFSWDHIPSGVAAYLHTNVLLSQDTVMASALGGSEQDKRGTDLLRKVFNVEGVQEAWVDRYKLRVERTRVVEWDSICRGVEEAVKSYCQEKGLVPVDSSSLVKRA